MLFVITFIVTENNEATKKTDFFFTDTLPS